MNLHSFFALLGGLLVLAFFANRLVRFTRVPDVLILMATGILLGPVLHWVNPLQFRDVTHGFGTLALILILFEGGLDLDLREIVSHFLGGFLLSLVSYALSVAAITLLCRYALQLPTLPALLAGSVIGCLSSSIILPVIQQVDLRRPLKVTLLVEATLGDALAVLTVSTLLGVTAGGALSFRGALAGLGLSLLVALLIAVLAGVAWSLLLPHLSEQRFWHGLTFAAVLLVFAAAHALRGNELVAVLLFGLTLSNFPAVRRRIQIDEAPIAVPPSGQPAEIQPGIMSGAMQEQMLTFHGELAFLIRTFFFVLIGLAVEFHALRAQALFSFGCMGALLFSRWLAVQSGRWLWKEFSAVERELLVWFLPRGLITAVLAIEVAAKVGPEMDFLRPLAFAIILMSNVIMLGGTFRARRLAPAPKQESPSL